MATQDGRRVPRQPRGLHGTEWCPSQCCGVSLVLIPPRKLPYRSKKILVAGQRASAGDFFKKLHILSIPWKFFHDCIVVFWHDGRRFFANHLLIVLVDRWVVKNFVVPLAQDLDPFLGNTWRGNEGGAGHHEGAIYLEQSSLVGRFGKGFDSWDMGKARMFSLFGNL